MARARFRSTGGGEAGFSYLALLILVAILALATSGLLTVGSIVQRRQAEQRLLEVGASYRQAISSYLNSSPAGDRRYPGTLAELLRDPRHPGVLRHIRQLYADPISGHQEWGLIVAPGGGIMGVHSLSKARPIKVGEFDPEDASFEGASSYSGWLFVALPSAAGPVSAPGQGGETPASISTLDGSPVVGGLVPQNPAMVPAQVPAPTPFPLAPGGG